MSLSLYKPNSKNTGCAFNFKIGANKNKEPVVYVTAIQQYSWDDAKKTANFSGNSSDEEKKINLKFTEFEIGGIMSAFKNRNEFSSYHSYDQSKTAIKFVPWDKKTKIKNGDKEEWVTLPAFGITFTRNGNQSFRIPVEAGEVENLLEFFRYFLKLLNEHRYKESLKNLEKYRAKREQKQEPRNNQATHKMRRFDEKKKVLIHSNHCKAFTGFGKHTKNILIHLQKTGKYDIVEFANGIRWGEPKLKNLPWKSEGSLPNNPDLLEKLNQDPQLARSAGYGSEMIDKIIEREKPDVYIGIEDIWAFSGYTDKTWWNKINCMIWTTLDSLPILPDAIKAASKIKNYYTWASFAQKSLNSIGQEHVKTLRGTLDTSHFYRLKDEQRLELRQRYNIASDDFIIGFVFRNQLRKSVPNLLEGFKIFCQQNPTCNAKLLLHTHWGEGWDIPRLLKEKEIDPTKIYTTYYCKECKEYEIKNFTGENLDCRFCGGEKTQATTKTTAGVDEGQLNEIYNLMDVYCHPFTSGGQEIPIQEAKLTELITLVTNYSCGEDCCVEEAASFPLSWTEYREPGTQFIKASTDPNSIANQLRKVFQMKPEKRAKMGKQARQFVEDNYSVQVVGKQLEDILDAMPEIDWDFDFKIEERDPNYNPPEIESDAEWISDLYKNILKVETNEHDDGHKHWMQRLNDDLSRPDVLKYFRSVAEKENRENKKVDLADLLDEDDEGKRLLIVMPERIGDVYLSTSLFPNIRKQYPDYNIYYATRPQYFEVLDGNPYIHKCIPYHDQLANLPAMEGQGDNEGYFEIVFIPFLGTQRIINFTHNAKDKIQFDLCTS